MSAEPVPKRARGLYRGVLGVSLLSLAVGGLALVAVSSASAEADKVTLCHATGSESNPYVEITVAENAVENGHGEHSDDIIPAFGTYGGMNMGGEGATILGNGCNDVKETESSSAKKVTLCHATGSETNPYVRITISENGAENGHAKHSGDIIPAFGSYGGQNMGGEGADILANDCNKVTPSESSSSATSTATETASTATATVTESASAAVTVTATATETALPAASESPIVIPTAEAGGNGPNAGGNAGGSGTTTTGGNQGATGPLAANAGGGSESGGGSPTWALALLGAGVAGTAISSLGLARKR